MTADEVFAAHSLEEAALAELSVFTTSGVNNYGVFLYFRRGNAVLFEGTSAEESSSLAREINEMILAHRKMKGVS